MAEAAALGADAVGVARRVRAIVAGSLGNLVEWYDFYAYSFTSLYFAAAFFPKGDRTSQLLQTAAIFAVGFLMRPLGGWFFGRFADRQGRRASMLLSVLLMCAGSLMIGFLPTHAQVGALAPALLLVARLVQGFSVGGEYGTSATYMSEVALAGRRGFFASFQYVTLIGGQLTAVVLLLPLQHFLGEEALRAWGWRIPFWVGAALALITLYLRRHLPETAPPEKRKAEAGTMGALLKHRRALLIVFGLTAAGSLSFYTFTTYMQKYLVNTAGLPAPTASTVMTGALALFMLAQPAFGALSDRVGRRAMLIGFGALSALCTWPILAALAGVGGAVAAFLLVMAALLITSLYTSISGLIKAELFPIEVRALGVGLAYGLANALFGGTAEYVALWFKDLGHETWFYAYVTALCVLGLITALNMHETFKTSALEED